MIVRTFIRAIIIIRTRSFQLKKEKKMNERILKDILKDLPTNVQILCIRDAYELPEIRISLRQNGSHVHRVSFLVFLEMCRRIRLHERCILVDGTCLKLSDGLRESTYIDFYFILRTLLFIKILIFYKTYCKYIGQRERGGGRVRRGRKGRRMFIVLIFILLANFLK